MLEEFLKITLPQLTGNEKFGKQLELIFQIILFKILTCWIWSLAEKVCSVFLNGLSE